MVIVILSNVYSPPSNLFFKRERYKEYPVGSAKNFLSIPPVSVQKCIIFALYFNVFSPKMVSMMGKLSAKESVLLTTGFVLLLWWVRVMESVTGISLVGLGVSPHTVNGLFGVAFAPLIHNSWHHLISNTLPILLLGSMLVYGYPRSRWWLLMIVWIGSGAGVWLFARSSYHVGASGIAHGLFFFLFIAGVLRRDKQSIALLMVAFFMYGTMLWTIFPQGPGISFEYHLFGAISGAVFAVLFRHLDPKPVVAKYAWELESEDTDKEDPIIGDQWRTGLQNEETLPGAPDGTSNSEPGTWGSLQ